MQKWKGRLKRGATLALTAAIVISSWTSIMTMPVSAENETTKVTEKKEQVDFHFPKSEVTVVENDPDFTIAAEGAAEGSTVTYSISADGERSATVDNNGTVHLKQEGIAVITAIASETDEYKSKEISYKLDILGADDKSTDVKYPEIVEIPTYPEIVEIPTYPEIAKDPTLVTNETLINKIKNEAMIKWEEVSPEVVKDTCQEIKKEFANKLKSEYAPLEWKVEAKTFEGCSLEVKEFNTSTIGDTLSQISTVDDVKNSMIYVFKLMMQQEEMQFVTVPVIYDVDLVKKDETGAVVNISYDSISPVATITVPYPKGTDRHKHDFIVTHMFTHEKDGHKPGDMEFPKVTKGERGITFTVTGFSPIAIACVEAKSEENPSESEKKDPQVIGDTFVWENGEVKIPVDLGDYTAEDLDVSISINGGIKILPATIKDNKVVASVFDFHYPDIKDHSFSKKGNYRTEVRFFLKDDHSEINKNEVEIQVPYDETYQVWNADQKVAKFDGNQDITFSFKNGDGYYALQSISKVDFFAWKDLEIGGEPCRNFSVGKDYYTYDMEAGTLTLNRNALKYGIQESVKLWVKSGKDIKDYPKTITINATAESKTGETIYYLSSIEVQDPVSGFKGTDGAWKIDITDYDLNLEDKKTEFSSDKITVSEESRSVIENNALTYIKNNYAEEFGKLGDNYTVSSKLNLMVQDKSEVQQEIKEGFQTQLGSKEIIGQYYDINILADVLQNGIKVLGLENISINKLDQKITINLSIPEDIRKTGRTYKILHYNTETKKSEILQSKVKDWSVSFETDSFSPYALVYSDRTISSGTSKPIFSDKDDSQGDQTNQGSQGNESANQPNNSGNQSANQNAQNNSNSTTQKAPKTADNNSMILYLILILCSIGGLVGVRKYKYCK